MLSRAQANIIGVQSSYTVHLKHHKTMQKSLRIGKVYQRLFLQKKTVRLEFYLISWIYRFGLSCHPLLLISDAAYVIPNAIQYDVQQLLILCTCH